MTEEPLKDGGARPTKHTETIRDYLASGSRDRTVRLWNVQTQQCVAELSGHSMRVGGAQDLMMSGHDTLMIMTAGGWKNVEVVARYVEKAAVSRSRFRPAKLA